MDLFKESQWYFDYDPVSKPDAAADAAVKETDVYRRTWYTELIQARLVNPRIPRFGVMTQLCAPTCQSVLDFRLNSTSPGYAPFRLFADIGNLVRCCMLYYVVLCWCYVICYVIYVTFVTLMELRFSCLLLLFMFPQTTIPQTHTTTGIQ
jgi:hypothetical protein